MRLLNTSTLQLTEFIGKIPRYAILSHTWETDEVLFEDIDRDPRQKAGWWKVTEACKVALGQRYDWIWIDTCCINKSSSAELSESINSMFKWYQNSDLCIVYLADVKCRPVGSQELFDEMAVSRWFTRGWTLQELLAPCSVNFYSSGWTLIASRAQIRSSIVSITGIDEIYLNQRRPIYDASVARRMSWAAKRNTTRVEDMAYCLLGLFQVNMPLIYGEGEKAFRRLQEAILREVDDQSIFAWGHRVPVQEFEDYFQRDDAYEGILADSPEYIEDAGDIVTFRTRQVETVLEVKHGGVAVSAPFWKGPQYLLKGMKWYDILIPLQCRKETKPLECIALYFTSTSPTAHESGWDRKRVPCCRVSSCLFSVQTSVWVGESSKFMLLFETASSRRETSCGDRNQGFLLRTLPRSCSATQIFPQHDPTLIIPFRPLIRGPKAWGHFNRKLSPPTIVHLRRIGFPDLALVLQTTSKKRREHMFDPHTVSLLDTITRIVVIPTGKSLGEVGEVIKRETEHWSSGEILTATGWKGAYATRKSKETSDRPTPMAARLLQRSKLELFDDFDVFVSQDISYGDGVFLLDIKDPTGRNVSLEPSVEEDAPTFTLMS